MEKTVYTCEKGKWVISPHSDLFIEFDGIIDSDCEKCEYRDRFVCELKKIKIAHICDCHCESGSSLSCHDLLNKKNISKACDLAYESRLENLQAKRWSNSEILTICDCNSGTEAWLNYLSNFGYRRSKKAVVNKYKRLCDYDMSRCS